MHRCLLPLLGLVAISFAQQAPPVGQPSPTETTTTKPPTPPTVPTPVDKKATYWITFGKTIRPGLPMIFQVRIFEGTEPVDVFISLVDGKKTVLEHGPVSVLPGDIVHTVTVNIPKDIETKEEDHFWYQKSFNVRVTGNSSEIGFKKEGYVTLQEKSFSIFIQTDKAMYKPSQLVRFRTLAMNPDMKVLKDAKQDIVVMDSKGNRILQYKGLQAPGNMGVVQKHFKLADSVPVGMWKIKVTIQGIEEEKEFEVADYVLPRFEVEIDAPTYAVGSDTFYDFKVSAQYTFGKPVTEGVVHVAITCNRYFCNSAPPLMRRGLLDENGELKVQVTVAELRKYMQSMVTYEIGSLDYYGFYINANVTETRTRKVLSATQHAVQFYRTPIKIQFLGITPSTFKSGLDFTAYVEVRKQDGTMFSALDAKQIGIKVNVTYRVPAPPPTTLPPKTTVPPTTGNPPLNISESNLIPHREIAPIAPGGYWYPRTVEKVLELDKTMYALPETGWVIITFRVPEEANSVTIGAETESSIYPRAFQSHYLSKSHSPSKSFLQLSVVNKQTRVGDVVTVQAKATDDMKVLNYQVFSKGLLLIANEVEDTVNRPSKSLEFNFQATAAMSPSMSIVAFFLRKDGEFVVDALSLSVEGLFDDAVSINFTKPKVQPGEKFKAIVQGEENSVVFLLAVDKSVKLLKSGNDITQELVREELASYDYGNYGHWRYMFICGWPSYFGGQDASSVFQSAGVVVLTDGTLYNRYNDVFSGHKGTAMPVPDVFPTQTVTDGVDESVSGGSGRPPSGGLKKATRTRKYFPENLLWKIEVINAGGQVEIPLEAPDTITSWVASVFSAHPQKGLSVAETPAEIITFRNMFISLDLPSSIVRGENFCFAASVFNYYKSDSGIPVMLTLKESADFSSIWVKYENGYTSVEHEKMSFSNFLGFMKENEVQTVTFCFTPESLGHIPIEVEALTDVDGLSDSVKRLLHVKPEGVPRATTVPYLVEPLNGEWTQSVRIEFPADAVTGSEKISVNIAGNLLGPVFDNLDDLLQKPYGCGEQNMINFSPIMSLLDFFFKTNTITDEFLEKAKEYMLIGYQKEILYEHGKTGGYSTFGDSDNTKEKASTWLTAFITKCFSQAEQLDQQYNDVIAIDTDLIARSVEWLLRTQSKDGAFVEHGRVFNKNLQGGSAKGVALTSYTVIALINAFKALQAMDAKKIQQLNSRTMEAVKYLESNLDSLEDPYDVCITTYALHLANSPDQDKAFVKMESMAKKGFGMTNWERPKQPKKQEYWWSRDSDAINIEMTSYALLTYSLRGLGTTDGLPIVRWLSKQKGPNGGFISTQDTVIGIEALTSVAKDLFGAEFVPMEVQVISTSIMQQNETTQFSVSKDNEMILQRKAIPYLPGSEIILNAKTTGIVDVSKSTVLIDVVFKYNVPSQTPVGGGQSYEMNHMVMHNADGFDLMIKIWTIDDKPASMTVVEVELAAGFSPDLETIKKENSIISKVDVKSGKLNVYIDSYMIYGDGIKLRLPMLLSGGTLIDPKAKSIRVYDYYESDNEISREFFLNMEGSFCSKVPEFGICRYISN